jgi:uncharacterized protein (TIGR02147 family)
MDDFRQILTSEFERRRKLNGSYSLRAFAKRLVVSPAQLSQLMSGKRPLSSKMASRIAEKLALSPSERRTVFQSLVRQKLGEMGSWHSDDESLRRSLEEERFRVISDWYHFAMLSLFEIPGARVDPKWIAKQLGIQPLEAAQALRRLQQLGLVKVNGRKVTLEQRAVDVNPQQRSAAVRRFHQQVMALASQRIETAPIEVRDFRAVCLAIDKRKLEKARGKIQKFFRELADELESGNKQEVYLFSTQLFPVKECNGVESNVH